MRHATPSLRRAALLAVALLLAGCTSGGRETAGQAASGRSADLDAVAAAYDELHPEPPDLSVAVDGLRERAGELTEEQWLVELMRLTAGRDRDGHTGVFPLAQPDLELWPLQLYAFADGWHVVAAQDPHGDLVGREVTAVGGVPVDEAVERLRPRGATAPAAQPTSSVVLRLPLASGCAGTSAPPARTSSTR